MTYKIHRESHEIVWKNYFTWTVRQPSPFGSIEIEQDLKTQGARFTVNDATLIPNFCIEFDNQEDMMEFILRWS